MISREELEGMGHEDLVGTWTVYVREDGRIYWVQKNQRVDSEEGLLAGKRVWFNGWVEDNYWWDRDYRFEEDKFHFRTLEDILEYFGEGKALRFVEEFL